MKQKKNPYFFMQTWFWLMIITIILMAMLLIKIYERHLMPTVIHNIITSDWAWTAVGSIGTLISVIIAVKSLLSNERIRKFLRIHIN